MPYILDPSADIDGTSRVAEIEIASADDARTFGPAHRQSDPYKVSACYSSTDGLRVFTLYDYKSTSLYQESLPSPAEFWNSRKKTTLSIGGRDKNAAEFKTWVLQMCKRNSGSRPLQ